MVLVLARRMFCPKDYRRHLELATLQDKLRSEVPHRKVVTISTDPVFESIEYRLQVGARWPLLSDPERKVQKDLQIQQYTDPKHDPMIPHTLVLEPGLVIYKGYPGYFFWGRPSREGLWRDLREVIRKRPDFDPTAPGVARELGGGRQQGPALLVREAGIVGKRG